MLMLDLSWGRFPWRFTGAGGRMAQVPSALLAAFPERHILRQIGMKSRCAL